MITTHLILPIRFVHLNQDNKLKERERLTLAERYRCIPLVDPLGSPSTCGTALANKPEALITAETQCAAQLCAC